MKYVLLILVGFLIFFIGLVINGIWLHSQNNSYIQILKKHVNDYCYDEYFLDMMAVVLILLVLCVPYVNLAFAVAINFMIFLRGLKE